MQIVINNCSSPGASFTENTNKVILSCYEWVTEHSGEIKPFIEFRREVSSAKGFNDNNARNIYPLLQNVGFIRYEKGVDLIYNQFFTSNGKAYAKTIETEHLILNSEYEPHEKERAIKKLKQIRETLVYQGLVQLLNSETNYSNEMLKCLAFLLDFHKISKPEFAYLLYAMSESIDKEVMEKDISLYRNNDISFDITVSVRNDIELRERTGNRNRKEGLSFLTAYSYFCGLFEQAGLIVKLDSDYYSIASGKEDKIKKLLEGIA